MFSWTGEVAKAHESKFHETLLSVFWVLTNEICLSCVCAEGTTPFSAAWQRLKIRRKELNHPMFSYVNRESISSLHFFSSRDRNIFIHDKIFHICAGLYYGILH